MIEEFTTKQMSDLLYQDLSEIKDDNTNKTEAIFQIPTADSIFPCRFIHTPLDSVIKSQNAKPILKDFQIIIQHWAETQEECMEMASVTDEKLQKRNILRTDTEPIVYDKTIQKYQLTTKYKVRWEGITNSFVYIK